MNANNERVPQIAVQTETEDEAEKEKPLPKCVLPSKNFMLTGFKPIKSKINSNNKYTLPKITVQTETEDEMDFEKLLPECVPSPNSFMLAGFRSIKPSNLKEAFKSIKYNDARKAVKRNVHNSPKLTKSIPLHMQPWGSRRNGKKLLVLDLDQTICDCSPYRTDKLMNEERRPYLTKFLNAVYEHYDIVIWSATEKYTILDKIHRLKLFSERSKLLFHLDIDDMLKIKIPIKGKFTKTSVKPLDTVWSRTRWCNSKNTLMIDDRSLNFISNPKNGLEIKAYHRSDYTKDNELLYLLTYLIGLAKNCIDFTTVNHQNWQIYKKT